MLAALGLSCALSSPSFAAKHRKHRVAAKSSVAVKEQPVAATPRTPVDKGDCISLSQALYKQAESASRRSKQSVPKEFKLVASNLDESCGEEDFAKARVSIDWMNTCLQNFSKDTEFCARNKNYYCAIGPQSESCQTE
jgi:hypothetical protein